MSDVDFERFAQSLDAHTAASHHGGASPHRAIRFERACVLGGDRDAWLLASLCVANDTPVKLFSAYATELDPLRSAGGVTLRGAGPIGTIALDRSAGASIETTTALDSAVRDSDIIFLTGPVHKLRTWAMVLAGHLRDGQVVVVTNARTFGALETRSLLRLGGCTADCTLVELQAAPWWLRASGTQLQLSKRAAPLAATLPAGREQVLQGLEALIGNLQTCVSTLYSSFGDCSGLVELPALALGGPLNSAGGPAVPDGAKPLPVHHNFFNLLGDNHRLLIEQLLTERRQVAAKFGVRDLPTVDSVLSTFAGGTEADDSREVPSEEQANQMLRCAVIASLLPLQCAAQVAAVAVPVTQAMTTLGSALLDADLGAAGRRLESLGVRTSSFDDARRSLAQLIDGESSGGR